MGAKHRTFGLALAQPHVGDATKGAGEIHLRMDHLLLTTDEIGTAAMVCVCPEDHRIVAQ
jgi:hypothetical protein